MKKVGIVMGSDSDLPIVTKAIDMLKEYGVPFEVHIYSAHRTPVEAKEFSANARQNGFGAIIAAAGMAAHLAGAIAANTTLPVIGIPVKAALEGVDALYQTKTLLKNVLLLLLLCSPCRELSKSSKQDWLLFCKMINFSVL